MDVETVEIDSLIPDPDNSRVHGEENIAVIEASLRRFGQVLPLVVHRGVVVGGNGTMRALRNTGATEAHITIFGGTKEEARALAIALNRSAELAEWDIDSLGNDLLELSDCGYTPESLGFDVSSLDALFPADVPMPAPPETPEPPEHGGGLGTPVIQYTLIFDTVEQQQRFHRFVRMLKTEPEYEGETHAERMDAFLADAMTEDA